MSVVSGAKWTGVPLGLVMAVLIYTAACPAPRSGTEGSSGRDDEPARPLGERGAVNITAFARLLGYIRYFHPSDESAVNDWDTFAIEGVRRVESAKSPAELKDRLDRIFRPLAPTLRLSTEALPPLTRASLGAKSGHIVGWYHLGFPGPHSGFYSSRRVVASSDAPGDSVLPIGTEVNETLGGGVWCSVPLTLYTGPDGTVPKSNGSVPSPRRSDAWLPTGDDRATRLADVLLFWNVIEHFFPYLDVVGTDWTAELVPALKEAATDPDAAAFEVTLRRMAATLHDGHMGVSYPKTVFDRRAWPFSWRFLGDRLVLTRCDPVRAKGASIGDEVTAIQGLSTSDWLSAIQPLESGATPEGLRVRVARALEARVLKDSVDLDLRSLAGVTHQARLGRSGSVRLLPARPDSVEEIEPGILYLDLNRVTKADIDAAISRMNAGTGVVLDLRGYPYRTLAADVIAHLTDSTLTSPRWGYPVVRRPDHRDITYKWGEWYIEPVPPRIRVRAAFLIDANAISAAETLLGFVEHYKLADLVGERTAATNGVVTLVVLPGGFTIPFTGMRVLTQDGSRHHGIGILPTVPVVPSIEGIAAGRDEQLERAMEVVKHGESQDSGTVK